MIRAAFGSRPHGWRAIAATEAGTSTLMEFITAKEITFSLL
jgi:hypothetical protein